MYDYVDFICKWSEYFVNATADHPGYYLYASDAKNYLEKGNMKYGTEAEYFDNLVKKIEAIDETAFEDLILNIREAEALSKDAYNKLYSDQFTYEYVYVEKFGQYDYVYTIIGGEELKNRLNSIYEGFELWLAGWEL